MTTGQVTVAIVSFAGIGAGAANIVPVLFRQAGQQQQMPASLAISAVTISGYAGYLLGPASIGWIAQTAGLPAAFWIMAALIGLVVMLAKRAAPARQPSA